MPPNTPPKMKASRQPHSGGRMRGSSTSRDPAAPIAAPIQKLPLITRSVKPRLRAGISSWMAALTAAYSPPIPAPVRKRNSAKDQKLNDSAGREGRGHVDQHGEAKQAFAPEHVCQIAEQQRAGDGASEIGGGSLSDLRGCQAEDRTLRDGRGQRPNERDFQPIQDPGDAEAEDHQPVELRPGQAVEPGRDVGLDDV